MDGSQNQIFES
jgi:hypothetical protein